MQAEKTKEGKGGLWIHSLKLRFGGLSPNTMSGIHHGGVSYEEKPGGGGEDRAKKTEEGMRLPNLRGNS